MITFFKRWAIFRSRASITAGLELALLDCDARISYTKGQMIKMGTLYKMRIAVPKLRELNGIGLRILRDLDVVTAKRNHIKTDKQA